MTDLLSDDFFMKEALKEARKALDAGEVPIGAVIVSKQRVIARGHNQTQTLNDPTAHAEMLAFTAATEFIGGKYLNDCVLYVTLEPCVMCGGASYWSQIGKIVYGASDAKRGYKSISSSILHPKTEVISGVLDNECSNLLIDFFRSKRKKRL